MWWALLVELLVLLALAWQRKLLREGDSSRSRAAAGEESLLEGLLGHKDLRDEVRAPPRSRPRAGERRGGRAAVP